MKSSMSFVSSLFLAVFLSISLTDGAQLQIQPAEGRVQLFWSDAGPNKVYTLQYLDDLNQSHWTPLLPWDNWPIPALSHADPLDGQLARFYRLAITERGRVANVTLQETVSTFQLNLIIFGIELEFGIDIPFSPEYAVDVYRVEYETLDALLGPTVASGALCVPVGINTAAPLLTYQHGTVHARIEAPSYAGEPEVEERYVGQLLASHGYVVAMPDYLGLGEGSTGLHPYVHRRSSATVVVDMLRAVRSIAATHPGVTADLRQGLSDKLFLFGYSQGGYVTLAAQQEMEQKHPQEFSITASAPSDGPYDLSGTMADVITADTPYPSPNYIPYVLLSYNEIYRLFEDPSDFMVEPYATTLPPLFNGEYTGDVIDAEMPQIPRDILQPALLDSFINDPNDPLRAVLRENDLLDWAPQSLTRLYHCAADDIVPFANSQVAYDSFIAAGADTNRVQLIDPDPTGVHSTCLISGVPLIIEWFDSLR